MKPRTTEEHYALAKKLIEKALAELSVKGQDYATGYATQNFDLVASRLDLDRYVVWATYFEKHVCALMRFAREKRLSSETLENRIIDAVNYLLLLHTLAAEDEYL